MTKIADTVGAVRSAPVRYTLIFAAVVLFATTASAQLLIYDDALQNGWQNFSYGGGSDFNNPNPVHTGVASIAFTGSNFNAVSFARIGNAVTAGQYPVLHFWINGGAASGQQLFINLGKNLAEENQAQGTLDPYITGGSVAAGQWREVNVTLNTLTPVNPPWDGTFDRIDIISNQAAGQATVYIDDVSLLPPAAPPPAGAIQIEPGVTVSSLLSDRVTWKDSGNQPRKASIAHDNVGVANANKPGGIGYGVAMVEMRYQLPNGATRVAGVTGYGNGGTGGFGYVTDHSTFGGGPRQTTCVGDDSPLGDEFPPGNYQVLFQGRHHMILRVTQNYRRRCDRNGGHQWNLPVTIDWLFMTGRDNPLWAITYDVDLANRFDNNAILAGPNQFYDDSRAPYGELNIDGNGAELLDGVSWGDYYKFTTTGATPISTASTWDWTQTNKVPFVKVWINAPLTGTNERDAVMGVVQTQTNDLNQQDAGGARDPSVSFDIRPFWTLTSASGNACGAQRMPCGDDWSYQSIGDSLGPGGTNNARMAWKTQYGFIGSAAPTEYPLNDLRSGSSGTRPGYPKKSYSTYIVMNTKGVNANDAVDLQRIQVETMQTVTLTASTGSVVTSGPSGITDPTPFTYQPAGYNHVYGGLAFNASGNTLVGNIAVGAGTLTKPLLIVGNYTAGIDPMVMLNGATLMPDADFFASQRPASNEVWITLNRDLTGANNNITVMGACAPVSITVPTFVAVGASGVMASIPANNGHTYAWTLNGGTITSGQGTASIMFSAGPAGTRMMLAVVDMNGGACAAAGTKRIQVDFADVAPSNPFHDAIATLALNGITGGCGNGGYCPNNPVLRSQMAIFLLRGEHGESYAPPPAAGNVFTDVPQGSFGADFIEQLFAEGITSGCASNPPQYCPGSSVLRSSMAIFLLRAKHGSNYVPPGAVGIFNDVPVGSFAADWIEELYNEGITGGCATNPLRYCPSSPVLRSQMAVFLVRTFNLQAANAPATISVDANANVHAIDPRIYGVAFADPATFADLGVTVNRWGGNATSSYNWIYSTANRCKDFYFENQPDPVSSGDGSNGKSADDFIAPTLTAGVDALITVPLLDWLPKDRSVRCGFPVSVFGAQDDADGDCGNGRVNGNRLRPPGYDPSIYTSTTNSTASQANWVTHIKNTFAGGVKYYALDNEPSLWSFDHWDVHPTGSTYDEVWQHMRDYAIAIKNADPNAKVTGVEEWGWDGYISSGLDQENQNSNDRNAHGGTYFAEWLLQQAQSYANAHAGQRLVDIFALHFYPQSGEFSNDVSDATQVLRNRSTRGLWDPTFVDLSYIGSEGIEGGIVKLIPRMKQWVAADYPGTQIAITEYNWGAENHINGATAQADILGIFGREGLDMGVRWTAPPTGSLVYNAFKMYRTVAGGFGDQSVSATGPNPDQIAVFAARRGANALTVMIIAKEKSMPADVTVNVSSFNVSGPAERWQLTSTNAITNVGPVTANGNAFTLTVPAQSITLLVIPGA